MLRAENDNLAAPLKRGKENWKASPGLMACHGESIAKQSEDYVYSLLLRRVIIAFKPNTVAKKTRTIAANEPSTQEKLSLQRSNIYCHNPHILVCARVFTNIVSPPWHFFSVLGWRCQLGQRFDRSA